MRTSDSVLHSKASPPGRFHSTLSCDALQKKNDAARKTAAAKKGSSTAGMEQMAGIDPDEVGGVVLLAGVEPNGDGWHGDPPIVQAGGLHFNDYPEFHPNLSPKQVRTKTHPYFTCAPVHTGQTPHPPSVSSLEVVALCCYPMDADVRALLTNNCVLLY